VARRKAQMTAATSTPLTSKPGPDGSETIAIRISELWKRYGKLEAVRGISFEVGEGEIFGLIGPDGAGKTSTFQILAGVMEASSGSAEVFGQPDVYKRQFFSLRTDLPHLNGLRMRLGVSLD